MRNNLELFLKGIFAGVMIGVAGTLYLSVENRYIGALLFGVGLFVIFTFGFKLFTGRVGYAVNERPGYCLELGVIWLGNLAGTLLAGYGILATRLSVVSEKAAVLSTGKLDDNPFSSFLLAVFCGLLMFIATDSYQNGKTDLQKHLPIFLCVPVFILCGFEHCIANMYFFTVGGAWSLQALGYLMVMTFGNTAGAFLIPLARKFFREKGSAG